MNNLLKNIQHWQKKPKTRREDGVYIVEGIKSIGELPKEEVLHVVVSKSFAKEHPDIKADLVVSDEEFEKLSDTQTPQGVLAVVRARQYQLSDLLDSPNQLFLVLENIQDPGNLGTMFRSGEAAGVSGLILSKDTVDPYNPKVIRSTMGAIFRVPFYIADDLSETVKTLQNHGVVTYAAHLKGAVSYEKNNYQIPTAFLIGNESQGLTDALTEVAKKAVKIPMKGKVESLNAAMAATILLFEAMRQRL